MRSYHADVAIEGPLCARAWQMSVYNREDRDYPWLPGAEFRVANGRLVLPSFTTRYENALDGHSRGLECSFSVAARTDSPAGWHTTWHLRTSCNVEYLIVYWLEEFEGDYDQRHTLNAYGVYRFSDRMSFSTRFRAGSNFPVPGYYESRRGRATPLSTSRNNLRVPSTAGRRSRQPHVFMAVDPPYALCRGAEPLCPRQRARHRPGSTADTPGLWAFRFDVSDDSVSRPVVRVLNSPKPRGFCAKSVDAGLE